MRVTNVPINFAWILLSMILNSLSSDWSNTFTNFIFLSTACGLVAVGDVGGLADDVVSHGFGSIHCFGSPPDWTNKLRLAALNTSPTWLPWTVVNGKPEGSLAAVTHVASNAGGSDAMDFRSSAGSPAESTKACQTSGVTL